MDLEISPQKKKKSPVQDAAAINSKTSVTCTNVPESLLEASAAKKHFSKFGRVQKIRLFLKKQMCIIEYDQPNSAARAVLNAGAYDGFMFDVTRTKAKVRRRSKREDDPDWVPDSDVEEELNAMGGVPIYRLNRQKPMEQEPTQKVLTPPKTIKRVAKQSPIRKSAIREKQNVSQPPSAIESAVPTVNTTTLSTSEAAAELHQLRFKVSMTPDEQWRTLDARDRILRAWGGAGSRVKVGGATIGTCPDMCPEKERLHRQAEHQVMTLETEPNSDGQLDPRRAVKQYSRSSADQEIPMCYELRPASVLMSTCAYLLHELADTGRMVSLADWFHFMWDRFRGIRKDIAQQALCCSESICLVEMCARFHAHCAASLADLEHTQFDQKLNTDNLTKCLQTLKHMYTDVGPAQKPREAEFRGYVALLNLGDANFWWEIKQLPETIQKSAPIMFAIKIFNALDNNNYVRFFRLVQEEATYIQACILLRYFNDVRARALARIVKAYAPRGGSRYPAEDLIKCLAFESIDAMKSFINHYGLRFAKTDDSEPAVILDRNQFIEDSDPYPISRSIDLIESKRQFSVGHVIAGGDLPNNAFHNHTPYSSFSRDGKLKDSALIAEDQTYDTKNDSNKDIKSLKDELRRLVQGGKVIGMVERAPELKANTFMKPDTKFTSPGKSLHTFSAPSYESSVAKFSFKPAIPVAPIEVINNSPEKTYTNDAEKVFSFSKPQETFESKQISNRDIFKSKILPETKNTFGKLSDENKDPFKISQNVKPQTEAAKSVFNKFSTESMTDVPNNNVFGQRNANAEVLSKNIFGSFKTEARAEVPGKNIFGKLSNDTKTEPKSVFGVINNEIKNELPGKSVFGQFNSQHKSEFGKNVFGQFNSDTKTEEPNKNLFGKAAENIFSKGTENHTVSQNAFGSNIFSNSRESSLFVKSDGPASLEKGGNIFAKPVVENEEKSTPNIFGAFKKAYAFAEPSNIFTEAVSSSHQNLPNTAFSVNGETKLSPGSLFKSVTASASGINADKSYSIFQSKNKAQSVADNILNSLNAPTNNNIYDFEDSNEAQKQQLEQQRLNEQKVKEEEQRILQERMRQEEEKRLELNRQEEERRKEEERRIEEARKKHEELKRLEQIRKKEEEERKQKELKKKLEEERQEELKRKAEEERKFKERVDKESTELVEELLIEVQDEAVREILKEEMQKLKSLVEYANVLTDELLNEMCHEISLNELKAEIFLTQKIMKKWFHVWKKNLIRNVKRRTLLEDTPVWLTDRTPVDEASHLRRRIEKAVLKNMNKIHRGYRFTGELKQLPTPDPYNIIDIIRSPLLKRMKQINYPYDKCFFWKVAIISPGPMRWLYRKLDIEKWLSDVFSDKKNHHSDSLLQVGKYTWNHLMDFAISVSMTSNNFDEALEGAHALAFYTTEKDHKIIDVMKETLNHKFPYQLVPVTVVIPKMEDSSIHNELERLLANYTSNKTISAFKIFIVDSQCVSESLNMCTTIALKWMAKKYPPAPPIEIDYLKSLCQRYLGNEIWCRLKSERDSRVNDVHRDLLKLVKCYNIAVDKLISVLTNEDLFNYPSFPLEFKDYLDSTSPYPKPYEFITSNVQTSENILAIKELMNQLKLPEPVSQFQPIDVPSMQRQIRKYCKQIGWFENPEEVVCKVVAILPKELSTVDMPHEQFNEYFENYDLLDVLNIIVYEKINSLKNFENRFAIYMKSALEEYRNIHWLYEIELLSNLKHKAVEYADDRLDEYIEAKRRKIALDSVEYLMLEDNDCTIVEDSIKRASDSILQYSKCTKAVKQLEMQLDVEKQKSIELENLLKAALSDV